MSPRRLFPRLMSIVMLVVWTVVVAHVAGPAHMAHAAVTNAWSALGSYSAGYTNTIDDILVNGSDVYIGGQFTGAGGVSGLDYLARWNGSSWVSVGTAGSINSRVNALAVIGNFLYVGGAFTNAGGVAEADGIAKFDLVGAGGWSAVGEQQPATGLGPLGGTASVTALEVDGSTLLVGGAFTDARSLVNTRHIARYTPSNTTWSSVAATSYEGASAFVASIAVVGSTTYIGLGNVSSGSLYPLMMYDNAGTFAAVAWGASWSTAKSFVGGDYPGVYALHADGTDLYVGGNFAGAGGSYGYMAKLATGTSTWSQVGDGSYCSYGSFAARCIRGITKVSGALYLQGDYGAARVNTGTNTKYDLGLGNSVSGMAAGTGAVYLGGLFTNAGGVDAADYLARFATSTTSSLDSMTMSAGVLTPAFSPGTLSYSVSTEDTTTTVTPAASNNGAGVSYSTDGGSTYTQVGTGSTSPAIPLSLGTNTVKVKVDPSDSAGTATVYTATITRTAPTTTTASTTPSIPPSSTTTPASSSSSSTSVVTQSSDTPGTTVAPQSTNATATTAAPQGTAPATTIVSTTSPPVRVGKSVTGSSLFKSAGGAVPPGAKVAVAVAPTSAKFCRVTGTSVKALKAGACRVTVSVTPKKGKVTRKTIVLRVN